MSKLIKMIIASVVVLTIAILTFRCAGTGSDSDVGNDVSKATLSKIAKHGEDVSIYVDFGIDSTHPRFFVYDNKKGSVISSSKCTHGCGGGSTPSNPVFSNKVGSNCSSLGEYKLTVNSRMNTIDMPCIRLQGLSPTNSNVARRGVVIHEAPFVADDISIGMPIPMSKYFSQGCFGISTKTFNLLQDQVKQKKSIYLYAVYKKQNR